MNSTPSLTTEFYFLQHRFFTEEPNNTNYEQIDLTLRLSPYGSVPAAEGEKGLVRFGDLQTMRRVRSGKRLVLEKQRREYELKMAWHNLSNFFSPVFCFCSLLSQLHLFVLLLTFMQLG